MADPLESRFLKISRAFFPHKAFPYRLVLDSL